MKSQVLARLWKVKVSVLLLKDALIYKMQLYTTNDSAKSFHPVSPSPLCVVRSHKLFRSYMSAERPVHRCSRLATQALKLRRFPSRTYHCYNVHVEVPTNSS